MKQELRLLAPEFALEEIEQHKEEIKRRTKLTEQEFTLTREELAIAVVFVPLADYAGFLRKAVQISPDGDDVDFFALALHLQAPLWSNDARLKEQKTIRVVSTRDLLNNPDFADVLYPID